MLASPALHKPPSYLRRQPAPKPEPVYVEMHPMRRHLPEPPPPAPLPVVQADPAPPLPVYGPPKPIFCRSTSSPGPCWDLVPGHEPSVQGEHMKQGLYRFNPAKAAREDAMAHPAWRALNRWRTSNSGLPPRPPAQAGVHIKD